MEKLFVLFDGRCGLCRRVAEWLADQPSFYRIVTIPFPSRPAMDRFPELFADGNPEEVLVVRQDGGVYRGEDAWIMCLYALKSWRELAFVLGRPRWRPHLRRVMDLIARNRFRVSTLLQLRVIPDDDTLGTC